ncbi:MAG: restriction endonuclease [Ktedonobacteraceae bacterium]
MRVYTHQFYLLEVLLHPLFDDRDWQRMTQAAVRLTALQQTIEQASEHFHSPAVQRQIELMNSPSVLRQIELLNSSAVRRQFDLMNTLSPTLQQYADRVSSVTAPLVQRYIAQLQTDLAHEPEEHEVLEHPETALILPETRRRIVVYSPSLLLLEKLRAQRISLHDLTWRQFEEVVAELLMHDGFMVELGRGTKDGGKDIVAVKEVQGCGLVMSVWQAKHLNAGNKVGISVIRELADTRTQLGASKGVIVTTTALTRDALERIEQNRYLLHKVDGDDLLSWIRQM